MTVVGEIRRIRNLKQAAADAKAGRELARQQRKGSVYPPCLTDAEIAELERRHQAWVDVRKAEIARAVLPVGKERGSARFRKDRTEDDGITYERP